MERPHDSQGWSAEALHKDGAPIPGGDSRAWSLALPDPSPIPVLIAVPHAGRDYPASLVDRLRHPARSALKLEDRYVDRVGETIARETGAALLVAHAPRAMIDLNRAVDEMDWDMVCGVRPASAPPVQGRRARSGLGLVPRRLSGIGELWKRRLEPAELEARIACVHEPYHQALSDALGAIRKRWGAALLIDLHSMPPLGSRRGPQAAPEFVFGDRFGASCDGLLCATAFDHLGAHGRRVAHNRPYAGGYVLERHAAPGRNIHAFQMEVCRAAYLDDALSEPGPGFASVVRVLGGLVRRLAGEVAALGRGTAQAAE
ncbi:N-formylglutamate amidohydrolase [Altericroceibacterium xinjiangense]|uniref:N-formylglutamate amidohydrolase n=1 Tax=Altericroceibacterium xinjiangense TaxID=762261 RepID=UPI000F7D9FC2|nr:N-formylglutamate amidohydrolase [Altericroceibacterium xinjiangense]